MTSVMAVEAVVQSNASPAATVSRQRLLDQDLVAQLEFSRFSMIPWWKQLAKFYSPRSPRFDDVIDNRGNKLNEHILNESPLYHRRALKSGLFWGTTNPSSRWFAIKTGIPELDALPSVQRWCYELTNRMFTILSRSNFYQTQAIAFNDAITYATGSYLVLDDDEDVINCVPLAVGAYSLGDDAKRRANTVSRLFWMTLRQLLEEFAPKNPDGSYDTSRCSSAVKTALKNNKWEQRFAVIHLIAPNPKAKPEGKAKADRPWREVYYERDGTPEDQRYDYLREDGYYEFPLMCFRWDRVQDEAWGIDCPAMQYLGGNKMLQKMTSKGMKLLDKLVDPPMTGDASLENKRVSTLPGAVTLTAQGGVEFKAAHEVRAEGLRELRVEQEAVEQRGADMFYTNLMLLIANDTRRERPTAEEVRAGSQEKYLVLGEVLESFNGSFRSLIDRLYGIMDRRGMVPTPPPELNGISLTVEYTSVMAIALKSVGLSNVERFLMTIIELQAQVQDPEVNAIMDWPTSLRLLEERSGLPPGMLRTKEDVDAILEEQAKAADEERRAVLMREEAKAMKDMSQTELGGDTAMGALTAQAAAGGLPGSLA